MNKQLKEKAGSSEVTSEQSNKGLCQAIIIGDMRIPLNKIAYYYPEHAERLVIGIVGKAEPVDFRVTSNVTDFKKMVEDLDALFNMADLNPHSSVTIIL